MHQGLFQRAVMHKMCSDEWKCAVTKGQKKVSLKMCSDNFFLKHALQYTRCLFVSHIWTLNHYYRVYNCDYNVHKRITCSDARGRLCARHPIGWCRACGQSSMPRGGADDVRLQPTTTTKVLAEQLAVGRMRRWLRLRIQVRHWIHRRPGEGKELPAALQGTLSYAHEPTQQRGRKTSKDVAWSTDYSINKVVFEAARLYCT